MSAKGLTRAAHGQVRGRARWYGWFCTNAAFAVGVVLWATVTSIVMVRTRSEPQK